MSFPSLPLVSASLIKERLSSEDAINALERALQAGLDPARTPHRSATEVSNGQLLFMPAEWNRYVGAKLVSVAPGNPAVDLERIQGAYLLFDAATLTPVAVLDGVALTSLRTPAMSALAARYLASPDATSLVVFGSGPQAVGHIEALRAVRIITSIRIVARNGDRIAEVAAALSDEQCLVAPGEVEDVAHADIVICATSSRTPLFDGALVPDGSLVIAVGSHEPDARELDSSLMARATVVVEDIATALREAGDVIIPISEGVLDPSALISVDDLIRCHNHPTKKPKVFKSVGMAWQDLVVAIEIVHGLSLTSGND